MRTYALLVIALLFVSSKGLANVVGSDAQNFNPTTNGIDFITVQSSETLDPGILNFGLFFNYAVNTLPYFPAAGGSNQSRTDFNDAFFAGDYNFGLGLFENWEVGASFPVLLHQSVDNTDNIGLYTEGSTEIRLNTKYRLHGNEKGGWALIGSVNFSRIRNNPFAGSDAGPTYNFEVAWDRMINKWAVGLNAGYRLRNSGDPILAGIDPMPSQYIASAAGSFHLPKKDLKLILELFTSFPDSRDSNNQTDRELSSAEIIGGVKYDYTSNLAFHAGAGTEVLHGASSPDWRVYVGANWTTGPHWKKTYVIESRQEYEKIRLPGLNFITATADVTGNSDNTLKAVAQALNELNIKTKIKRVVVEGHTDSVGSEPYNMNLSQLRAKTIQKYIIRNTRIKSSRIKSYGYGETEPIADNSNYQGRAKNRRVDLKVFTHKK